MLPDHIRRVVDGYYTCELSTMAKDGTPITWPVSPMYREARGDFIATTSAGLPTKAFNVRRDERVSMLFSNPTGSGLKDAGSVLVQGRAEAPDVVHTALDSVEGLEPLFERLSVRQPAGDMMSRWPLRAMTAWYYWRLIITITPERILHWAPGAALTEAEIIYEREAA